MGTWSATIGGNDIHLDIEAFAMETCGIEFDAYLENNLLLSKELFDKYYDEIANYAIKRDAHKGPLTMGALILMYGGKFSKDVKHLVFDEIQYELDKYEYDSLENKIIRHSYLKEFKSQIKDYVEGEKRYIKEESLIGLSFKREFLNLILGELERYYSPIKFQRFIRILLAELKTPLNLIFKKMGYSSGTEIKRFIIDLKDFGNNVLDMKENQDQSLITVFAEMLINHVNGWNSIKDFWLEALDIKSILDQNTIEENEIDAKSPYRIYVMTILGKKYVGSCHGSIHKRLAQHISKFIVAPVVPGFWIQLEN